MFSTVAMNMARNSGSGASKKYFCSSYKYHQSFLDVELTHDITKTAVSVGRTSTKFRLIRSSNSKMIIFFTVLKFE